ncbi:hypothetical protein [Bdellovibrio sp. HCB337]|uniref:hypothetical protein n=1 Tax=Bdellovibrio sp. HCB337 TaxID=3394358 RepID=UPI0039A6FAB2
MKRYVFAGFAFCLVVGFQNCSRNQLSDTSATNALSNPAEVTPAEKIDVSQTEILEVPESPYLEAQLQSAIQLSKPTSALSSHHLEIDVKTGVVHVVDQNNEVVAGVQYCLSSSDLNELRTILDTAKICEDKAAVDESSQCTMNYRFPYAKLHFPQAELALGEAMSGCHKGPDLCGDQKDMLQGFLAHVQSELASKKCEFQVVQK